uniref:Uncharacterized protein n=1 Tax=Catharus ustulatus TaxID=91951 RepID=A0A8C3UXL2_CATUS
MAAPEEEEALVTELYRFRDSLPPRDDGGDRGREPGDALVAEMERTVKRMEEIQVSPEGRGRALVLRARALGVAPEVGGDRAELALGHALKLDPALGAAWRQLGEQRWRRGDLRGARDAFGGDPE